MFIRDSRRSYRDYSYAGLTLITNLFSVGTLVAVTELILCRTYTYNRLIFSRDSRRSYRTYLYSELIVILRSLHLFGGTRRYHIDYETCTGIAELILIRKYL